VGFLVASAAPAVAIVNTLDYPVDWHIYIAGEKQWAVRSTALASSPGFRPRQHH